MRLVSGWATGRAASSHTPRACSPCRSSCRNQSAQPPGYRGGGPGKRNWCVSRGPEWPPPPHRRRGRPPRGSRRCRASGGWRARGLGSRRPTCPRGAASVGSGQRSRRYKTVGVGRRGGRMHGRSAGHNNPATQPAMLLSSPTGTPHSPAAPPGSPSDCLRRWLPDAAHQCTPEWE